MNTIIETDQVVKRLSCNHPKVLNIWEYGGLASIPTSAEVVRHLCLLMNDGAVKTFTDNANGDAIKEAEQYLSTLSQ